MSERSAKVSSNTLNFVRKFEKVAAEQGLTDPKEVDALFNHMLKGFGQMLEAFPNSDPAMQLAQQADSFELYKYAQDAAENGNDLAEIGPLEADGTRNVVYMFMAGTLLELRDEARESGGIATTANSQGNILPA